MWKFLKAGYMEQWNTTKPTRYTPGLGYQPDSGKYLFE